MTKIIVTEFAEEEFQESVKRSVLSVFESVFTKLPSAPEPTPEFITRKETCRILGITLPTLNEWTKNGVYTSPTYRITDQIPPHRRLRFPKTS